MKLSLFPHGGSGNHGCEAIVRSTLKILNVHQTWVFCASLEEDYKYGLNKSATLLPSTNPIVRFGLKYWRAFWCYRIRGCYTAFDELLYSRVIKQMTKTDFTLCIGGDNYCYSGMYFFYLQNRLMDKASVKRILWGASVEPSAIDSPMLADLKGYYKIVARESITYSALKEKGLEQIVLFPDPAFVLDMKSTSLPNTFVEGNTVGINISPMIIGYENNKGVTLNNYVSLASYLLRETNMSIALIPHVVWSNNDDREALAAVLHSLSKVFDFDTLQKRVSFIQDRNCEELKYIISKCRFMVAARTHAGIAAYSTQVPTLVVGYSVKATGIARDLFGDEEHYVVPVQSLKKETDLLNAFLWICRNENEIREHYKHFMPLYINKAELLSTILA